MLVVDMGQAAKTGLASHMSRQAKASEVSMSQLQRDLPPGLEKYRETSEFNEVSVPAGLLRDHSTASGVWGLLVVAEGSLNYTRSGFSASKVTPESPAVIFPEEKHHITCAGPVRFKVEFYRTPR